jgi:serine/threonine-protein kinase
MASFGRYEILDKLGEGAMGVVYRARDNALGRTVALKMLSADLGAEDELHERFSREAEAIGRLNHPSIVTVYDLGESEGHLYMAMELLEGDDLRQLIERQVDVPVADRVRILAQICDGLGYAHARGIVHRDIKPANILVTSSASAKILDFGLARVANKATITKRGVILGTPDYMAPEQAMGKTIDHRTDLFSAGSVFYEFLTYQKPFKGKTLHAVLYQIISESPDPMLTVNPELPARLAVIVHRMLEKDPAKRYQSLEDVARDLREIHAQMRKAQARTSAGPSDDARGRAREHLAKSRAHLEAGRLGKAVADAREALALDPGSDESAEVLWRTLKRLRGESPAPAPTSPTSAARVDVLLAQAAPGKPEAEAQRALAELALIAPDDPRVVEVMKERWARSR